MDDETEKTLDKCPQCGNEISNTAKKCIHCGYLIKKPKKNFLPKGTGITTIVILTIIIILGIGLVVSMNGLNEEEKESVAQVMSAITSIEVEKDNDDADIRKAERLYNSLSAKCQHYVKNHDKLISARAEYDNLKAKETMELIEQIGTVTLDSQNAIEDAKKAYNALSDEQKALVDNKENISNAMEQLLNLRLEDATAKISAIGAVTLNSEEKIKEARSAYDSVPNSDKSKVNNYDVLLKAEDDYTELLIANCITLINNIGQITLDSKNDIDNAKQAYDSLSKESKEKVTNYDVLINADIAYKELKQEEADKEKILNPGDSFSTSKWQVTYKKTNISAKVFPNNTNGYYSYYYASDDKTFVDVIFNIKNIDVDILGIDNLIGSCEIEYGDTTYTKSYNLYTSNGSDIDKVYSWDGLDALNSTTLHVAISMPREAQTNDKSITVRLTIAGEEKIINVR